MLHHPVRKPGSHRFRRAAIFLLVCTALGGAPAELTAGGAGTDVRTFSVTVDGKAAGTYTLTVATDADGKETATAVSAVKIKQGLITYTYESKTVEVWKKGQLASMESTTNDNGKRLTAKAAAADGKLLVSGAAGTRKLEPDALTTTGLRPPAADKARDAVLLDTEDGTDTAVRVEPLGACRVTVAGQTIEGTKFKLTGKNVASEWWYDKNGRVIRQEMKWDGHTVVFTATAVGR